MYIKPGYTPPGTSPPPVDAGRRLATLPRRFGELRIALSEYQGHQYISFRVWEPGAYDPGLYPTQKGVSVRTSELDHVISALEHAKSILDGERPREDRRGEGPAEPNVSNANISSRDDENPRYIPKRGRPRPRILDPSTLTTPAGAADDFDEFDRPGQACGNHPGDGRRDRTQGQEDR